MTIRIKRGTDQVEIDHQVTVERSVGRPGAELQPGKTTHPIYVDKPKAASDVFTIDASLTGSTPFADAKLLAEDIVREPLGRDSLTLEFVDTWGLDTYEVIPVGSQASRVSWTTGEHWARLTGMELRVVGTP